MCCNSIRESKAKDETATKVSTVLNMHHQQSENHICRTVLVLISHVAITSTWVISLRISRSSNNEEKYSTQFVVFLAECLKFSAWNLFLLNSKGTYS